MRRLERLFVLFIQLSHRASPSQVGLFLNRRKFVLKRLHRGRSELSAVEVEKSVDRVPLESVVRVVGVERWANLAEET